MRAKIIGPIIGLFLGGCGAIYPASPDAQDLGASVDVTGLQPDGKEDKPPHAPPDAGWDGAQIETSTSIDAGALSPEVETPPSQDCAAGTCYPKSDPNHSDCPCHY
jgi:hypothetical protein